MPDTASLLAPNDPFPTSTHLRSPPPTCAPDSNSEGSSDDGNWQREFQGAGGKGRKHMAGDSPEHKMSPGFVEDKTEEQIVAELQSSVLKVSLRTVEEQVSLPLSACTCQLALVSLPLSACPWALGPGPWTSYAQSVGRAAELRGREHLGHNSESSTEHPQP